MATETDWQRAAKEVIARFTSDALLPSQRQALIALGDALRAARSPQGEDYEAVVRVLNSRMPLGWPEGLPDAIIEALDHVSLSPDGTVAVEDVEKWMTNLLTRFTALDVEWVRQEFRREFARPAPGEQTDHGGNQ